MFKRVAGLLLLLPAMVMAQALDKVEAVVNDGVITASELNAEMKLLKLQISAKKAQMPSESALRKQVLQHLIDMELELQLAKQNNMTVDNTELNDAIAKIAAGNKLTPIQLKEAVAHQGMSWQAYRENIRREILISRLQQKAVGREVKVTPQQVEDFLKTSMQENKSQYSYHLQNIVIPVAEESTEEQLSSARKLAETLLQKIRNGADFNRIADEQSNSEFILESSDLGERPLVALPEVFAKQVINMKAGQVVGPLRTGNGFQLIKLVSLHGNNERHEVVKTHVRHILLKTDNAMTATEAREQAASLLKQLKSGRDFTQLARQRSADTGSASKGGDLGWVTPGTLVPEFEKAMDALPLNQVSKPVKSMFGWHLIEVLERKKVDDSSAFKRQQAHMLLQQKKFSEAVENWHHHLRTSAYIKILDKELA